MYVYKLVSIILHISAIFVSEITCTNVGTVLFNKRNVNSNCWSKPDVAKLRARQIFEKLTPPIPSPETMNGRYIKDLIHYYKSALRATEKESDIHTKCILKESLADVIGGHLRYEMLPTSRIAYYAGYVPYKNVKSLHNFFDKIKSSLNTQGIGWKEPLRIPQRSNMTVAKIILGPSRFFDSCLKLVTKRDTNACIHLPPPKLDDNQNPAAMILPFKRNGLISLTSPYSDNVLLKYYTTASKCILRNSPPKCRHSDFLAFNRDLWHWMKRDVAPHLMDEKLYSAYAGILRVAAAVQNYGKGISRRNLFEADDGHDDLFRSWNPWKAHANQPANCDWNPLIYVAFVILAAVVIYLIQMCQHYLFGSKRTCRCSGVSKKPKRHCCGVTEVAYSSVDTNIPAILPPHPQSAVFISDKTRKMRTSSKSKTASLTTFKTQRVYDLNENTEKMMAVIMSDNEDRETGGGSVPPSLHELLSDESDDSSKRRSSIKTSNPNCPPIIETQMSHLKLEKCQSRHVREVPVFSVTGSVTRSEMTYPQDEAITESVWSGTGSCSSASSSTSKTRSRRTRSARDLAWARSVISKQASLACLTKSTSIVPENNWSAPSTKR